MIAKDIREDLNLLMEDVFRTPLSGGHPGMRAGDLSLSPKAKTLFPFSTECKHVRNWHVGAFVETRKQEDGWVKQCLAACNGLEPLLVMSGNGTGAYAATRRTALRAWAPELLQSIPRCVARMKADGNRVWVLLPWEAVREHLRTIKSC